MDKRILWGCIAALGLLVAFAVITMLLGAPLNQALKTPLGDLPVFDLLGVLVAMAAGGAIAGVRFAWIAAALMAVVWVTSLAVLAASPTMPLMLVLKLNAMAMLLSLALAVLGARLGAQYGPQWLARISRRA
ncbi:hypothetical protein HIV01_014955 [Lysobacter arenosi]|jgi:hypothetical protein|uniref:DUF4175 domain-containing protein n=1 Tax=Lysobacter arenosi TaxID=2795387 RepID=A0ABX7R8N9_9GAMM|nr:hypothetical protein [Lysobacter arenosi]QSX74468.1 hypothetical protein HIV01_014955 [Lysobacter arenosi]